VKRNKQKKQ